MLCFKHIIEKLSILYSFGPIICFFYNVESQSTSIELFNEVG